MNFDIINHAYLNTIIRQHGLVILRTPMLRWTALVMLNRLPRVKYWLYNIMCNSASVPTNVKVEDLSPRVTRICADFKRALAEREMN